MNAKLAAMLALGDLQRFTGPDQRVTARADIMVEPDGIALKGRGRWTGVWSSKADLYDREDILDGLDERRPFWLVSGDNPDSGDLLAPSVLVDLAIEGGSVMDKSNLGIDDSVQVPAEEILGRDGKASGRFAYWVSDEGVKARLDLEDPYLEEDNMDAAYYRRVVPQVADPTSVTGIRGTQPLGASSSFWKMSGSKIEKITSLENIPMMLEAILPEGSSQEGVNREFFHDFSVHSSSVLSDTKRGGLRRDLSNILASDDLPDDLRGPIFEPYGGLPTPGNPGGPKWEQLADYFQLSESLSAGPVEMRMPSNDQVGIVPVVTRWNFLFHPFAGFIGDSTLASAVGSGPREDPGGWLVSDYEYSLGLFPLITLWNPYDRDLVLPEEGIGLEVSFMQYPKLLEKAGSRKVVVNFPSIKWRGGSTYRYALQFVLQGGVTIPAGRAMNFSPPVNSFISLDEPDQNVLVPGATGSLIRGFFTEPVGSTSDASFLNVPEGQRQAWNHSGKRTNPILALRNWSGRDMGMWIQTMNLYDLSEDSDFSIDGSNRFKSLSFRGLNKNINQLNTRVIRLNRALLDVEAGLLEEPLTFSSVIAPVGESKNLAESESVEISEEYLFNYEDFTDRLLSGRHCGVSTVLKFPEVPIDDRERKIHLLRQFNPTASFVSRQEFIDSKYKEGPWYTMYTWGEKFSLSRNNGDFSQDFLPGTDSLFAPLGWSNDEGLGSDRMVVYELPQAAPLNIGQLMHANLMNITENDGIPEVSNGSKYMNYKWYSNIQQPYAAPAYAIGNSEADVHIPLGQSKIAFTGIRHTSGNFYQGAHYDYSYELNDALWDGFFFSGINSEQSSLPLPNARFDSWRAEGKPRMDRFENDRLAAAQMVLKGGFNVNSTSVAAWESILGSMREINTLGEAPSDPKQLHNFSRFLAPFAPSSQSLPSSNEGESLTAGYRNLTDAQISVLAREIVVEIRNRCSVKDAQGRRYPFLSLSAFINRSLDTTTESFSYRGALQAAIDRAGINGMADESGLGGDGLWETSAVADLPNYGENNLQLESRPLAEGMLGYLTQADLLNKIGSILQARSDTFTVRSYGSAYSQAFRGAPSGAYLEMIVQRLPVYVDPSDPPEEQPRSPLNLEFGRRYKIVSTRWLESDEI
ncbi:MAG: hypothetical protein ACON46_05485 [Coraliomargaritaceae bacterium]